MAKVRYIPVKRNIYDLPKNIELLGVAFNQYNDGHDQVDENTKQIRFKACAECEHLSFRMSCDKIGSCKTGRQDFFKMHLNRKKGGCPIGQW